MRVLHLIHGMGNGGAERQLSYLSPALARRGHDVHVGLLKGGPNQPRLLGQNVQLHQLPNYGNHDPRLAVAVGRLVLRLRPGVIQTWLTQMDVLGGVAGSIASIPWVLSERGSTPCYPPNVKNASRRLIARLASAVAANSAGGLEYWNDLPARIERAVIPNALPLEEIDAARAIDPSQIPGPNVPILLHVGRLSPEKNVLALISAFARSTRPIKLVLVGDGPDRYAVESLSQQLGLAGRVVIVPSDQRVWQLMKAAVATISLSHYEGQPNVLLEAMASGCPIIASDIPAHRELLDTGSALLIDRTDLTAVATAIDEVSNGRGVIAANRAAAAQATVQGRTFARCAQQYEDLYERSRHTRPWRSSRSRPASMPAPGQSRAPSPGKSGDTSATAMVD